MKRHKRRMAIPTVIDWIIETIEENNHLVRCLFYLHTIDGQAVQVIQATPASNNTFTYEISFNIRRIMGSRFIDSHPQHCSSHFNATDWLTSFIINYPLAELISHKFFLFLLKCYKFKHSTN